jgi:hypothetical protein
MAGIIGIIALLTVLALSLFITRLASVALSMTGLSEQAAMFQARSAFTGTGFTTSESEQIVNHPVRRRIVMILMVLRSAGLVTIVISVLLSFVGTGPEADRFIRLLWLIGGSVAVLLISHIPLVKRAMERLIGWALSRWTDLNVRDYARLLKLSGDYNVTEIQVQQDDWVEGKQLRDCDLADEGVTVLGIQRPSGDYVGAPRGSTNVQAGDTLILYGRAETLSNLAERRQGGQGDAQHAQAVGDQQRHVQQEQQQERRRKQDEQQGQEKQAAGAEQ